MREKSKSEWPTWISTPCEESVQSTSISFALSFLGENKKNLYKVTLFSTLHLWTPTHIHSIQHLTFLFIWHPLPSSEQTNVTIHKCMSVSSRQHPATTTLPSEGHQNVLVNAAFVFRPGGWWGVATGCWADCTASTTDHMGWKGEAEKGQEGEAAGFKEAIVHLQVSPLGWTRCESLPQWG